MRILAKKNAEEILKQISFNKKIYKECLSGKRGEKKQLLALVLDSYEDSFLNLVLEDKKLSRLDNIQYLDLDDIESLFGFRKNNMLLWKTENKKRLLRALKSTPLCFVSHVQASMLTICSMSNLFPIPDEEICQKCDLYTSCEGSHHLRHLSI